MKKQFCLISIFTLLFISANAQLSLQNKLGYQKNEIYKLVYSPDNKYIAGSTDKSILVWTKKTSELLYSFKEVSKKMNSIVFSYDGKYLISGGEDKKVHIWELSTGKLLTSLKGHKGKILSIDIDPNNQFIASGGSDGKIKIWDLQSFKFLREFKGHSKEITSVSFNPSGDKLISGSADKTIKEWNVYSGAMLKSIKAHKNWVRDVKYSPEGNYIVSCGDDGLIQVWHASNGMKFNTLKVHKSWVHSVSFSPDGNFLVSGSHDKFFIIWNIEKGTQIYTSEKQENIVHSVGFSPDGKSIAIANMSTEISVWDASFLQVEKKLIAKKNDLQSLKRTTYSEKPIAESKKAPSSDVDVNIPHVQISKPYRFALIIGNEDYGSYQKDLNSEVNVTFAENDALIFKEYAVKTLGIDQENVIFLQNAKAIEMHRAIEKISLLIKNTNGKAEVFFYYAGHGFPDEQTKESYLMPVDISGTDLRFAVKLKNVYASLTKYPSQKITLFLDACFSGGARNQGLLAARGVKVRTKQNMLNGNLIVFSASSGDQSSLPYKEKEHGLFTYYLLKSFQESKGNLTYRKLSDYLSEKVGVKSVLINNKEQNPQTNISPEVINSWEKWELNK